MRIKVPNQIKIGGHWVKIFYEENLSEYYGKNGQARLSKNELALDKELAESQKSHALIHELFHFIDNTYNNYKLDEDATNALATGIHTLLVDLGVKLDWSNISVVDK